MDSNVKQIIVASLGRQQKSNCFLSLNEIIKKIENNEIDVIEKNNVVLLIEKKLGFSQLYYFLSNLDIEEDVWDCLREQLQSYEFLSLHIVNKEQEANSVVAKHLGFSSYKTYIREQFINKNKNHACELMNVEWAVEADNECVFNLLYKSFDVLADNLVDQYELARMICEQQVLKIEVAGKIQGIILFEDVGVKSYVRAVCVDKNLQNKGMGYSLLARYYNLHLDDTKLFYLWVDKDKKNAMKLYDKFGYKPDGLVNHIYTRI